MIRFDWHVHSALSGCAENTMSPRRILERARAARLDSLAITDHNASAHAALCFRLAAEYGITLVPGVEVSSREEVHVFRARNSLMSQLGSIDAGAAYDALQLGARSWRQKGLRVGDCVQGFPAFPASDAHFLDDVGRVAAELTAPGPGLQALMGALRKRAHE